MSKSWKGFFFTLYLLILAVTIMSILVRIDKLILFDVRENIICSDGFGFIIFLTLSLTFCAYYGILKLYKRFFEKTKIQINKTQFGVLIACLVFSVIFAVYGFVANKTEISSDGNIKVYDYIGRVAETRTVSEAERVELKVDRVDHISRYRSRSSTCYIIFSLYFPDGEVVRMEDEDFRDIDAMKTLKELSGDKLIILHDREKAREIIGAYDYELYEAYCELLPKPPKRPLTYYEENWDQYTYYEFGF